MSSNALPPGPKGIPFFGSAIPFFKDILGFLKNTAANYGDIAYFRLGNRKIYMINHPDDIQDVLITNNKNFLKSRALQRAKLVVGEGLLTSEGETHLKNRRSIQPIFHNRVVPEFADTMVNFTNDYISGWENSATMDIHREMMEITQQIVVKTLFDSEMEDSSRLINSLSYVLNQFPRFLFPFSEYLDKIPIPSNIKCNEALKTIDDSLYKIIGQRKSNLSNRYDLLSLLLQLTENSNGNSSFDDIQVRDEVITFYIAGQETTSNALCWTWYLISQNKEVEEKIDKEISEVLGDRLPDYKDLGSLTYIQNTVKESLRMYPPAWVITRRAINDYKVGEYNIPSGADIYMSQYVVHYDKRFYSEPEIFNPDRWDNLKEKELHRFAFFPFGGGTRRCIGEPFAMMEAVLLIATIASKWKLRLEPDFKVEAKPLITLRPKYGLKMVLERK
ncbi:MAG: cytochrome P450 [Thermodesulfobacteriota bacterium]